MSDEVEVHQPKIGEGHVAAMGRAGLKELSQILPAFPEGVRPVEEAGLVGNPTPQIVTAEMGASNTYQDMLESHVSRVQADQEQQQGQER